MHHSNQARDSLSKTLTIFLFLLSASIQVALPCEISKVDQARLIWLIRNDPFSTSEEVAGTPLGCLKVTEHIRVIREMGSPFIYVLDEERTFDRWTKSMSVFPFDVKHLIRLHMQVAEYDSRETWMRFGKVKRIRRKEDDDYSDLRTADSDWRVVRWLGQEEYLRILAKPISPALLEAIRASVEIAALAFLSREGIDARSSILSFNIDSELATRIEVKATVGTGKDRRTIELEVPINCFERPFAGWPSLLTRDL